MAAKISQSVEPTLPESGYRFSAYKRPAFFGSSKRHIKRIEGFLDPIDDAADPIARIAIASGLLHISPRVANLGLNAITGGLAALGGIFETYFNILDTINAFLDPTVGQRKSRIGVGVTSSFVGLGMIGIGIASLVALGTTVAGSTFFPSVISTGMISIFGLQLSRLLYTGRQAKKAVESAELLEQSIKRCLETDEIANQHNQVCELENIKVANSKKAIIQALIEREELEEESFKFLLFRQLNEFLPIFPVPAPSPLKNHYFAPVYHAMIKVVRCQPISEQEQKQIEVLLDNAKPSDKIELAAVMSAFKTKDGSYPFSTVAEENVAKANSNSKSKAVEIAGQVFVLAAAIFAVVLLTHVLVMAPWVLAVAVPAISIGGGLISMAAKFAMSSSEKQKPDSKIKSILNEQTASQLSPEQIASPGASITPKPVVVPAQKKYPNTHKLIRQSGLNVTYKYGRATEDDLAELALIREVLDPESTPTVKAHLPSPGAASHTLANAACLFQASNHAQQEPLLQEASIHRSPV